MHGEAHRRRVCSAIPRGVALREATGRAQVVDVESTTVLDLYCREGLQIRVGASHPRNGDVPRACRVIVGEQP